MPNKNYVKGRRKEYKIRRQLQDKQYIAFRSAGSHSPVDVVGIHVGRKEISLIQCKPDSMSANAKKKLEEENAGLNGTFEVRFLVI